MYLFLIRKRLNKVDSMMVITVKRGIGFLIVYLLFIRFYLFPCIKQLSGSISVLATGSETVLILSFVRVVLLRFPNRWIQNIKETLSFISADIPTAWPICLMIKFPVFFGNALAYWRNVLEYIVLALSWIAFLYIICSLELQQTVNSFLDLI